MGGSKVKDLNCTECANNACEPCEAPCLGCDENYCNFKPEEKQGFEGFKELWDRFNADCYGSGEYSILCALRKIFLTFEHSDMGNYLYDYEQIIKAAENESLGWSLIVLLDHADFIDWGTSIRYGWTDNGGTEFVKFILNNKLDELYLKIMEVNL
jgi:hypothetical protein